MRQLSKIFNLYGQKPITEKNTPRCAESGLYLRRLTASVQYGNLYTPAVPSGMTVTCALDLVRNRTRRGPKMAQNPVDFVTLRPWREIALELSREPTPERVLELSKELDNAFEAQEALPAKKAS
jgi:hypothetical protein